MSKGQNEWVGFKFLTQDSTGAALLLSYLYVEFLGEYPHKNVSLLKLNE